ncbi:NUDIX hydrolase [Neokomagataea tanensis]|nr:MULTISPECIES: hypothetical protein [Neokomagataea]
MSFNQKWPTIHLNSDIKIKITNKKNNLFTKYDKIIEEIWLNKKKTYPTLYNGRVFCVDSMTPDHIHGHWDEYKNILAQMSQPALFAENPLKPLAVVGLFKASDGVIIGRRAKNSIYLPGYWQGLPAGNVETREESDHVDLKQQILAEALEELGLSAHELEVGPPLIACEHPDTHIIDIGIALYSRLPFDEVEARCQKYGNAEYDALMCLVSDQPSLPDQIVPTLIALLEYI